MNGLKVFSIQKDIEPMELEYYFKQIHEEYEHAELVQLFTNGVGDSMIIVRI